MSVEEIKVKFPEDVIGMSDQQIQGYADASDALSELFISSVKARFKEEDSTSENKPEH